MGVHTNTPVVSVFDPRGLPIRTIDYWRDDEAQPVASRISRTVNDAAGHGVRQWDARLWALQVTDPLAPASLVNVCSLNAQVLRSDSVDAGTQIELHGPGGQRLFAWDSRGTRRETEHDALLRPTAVYEEGATESRRCVERFTYGRPAEGDPGRNQLRQLIRHDDPAGSVVFDGFALTGQAISDTRHFTLDPAAPDWPVPVADRQALLEPGDGATTRQRFAATGPLLEHIDARGHRQFFELTCDGRLRASHLQLLHQPGAQTLISDIAYSVDGQVEQELTGNGIRTSLCYRPEDGRLLACLTERASGEVLQHLLYDYDPTGNIVSIEDQALPVRFFANQRIEPVSRFRYDSLYQLIEASGWEAADVTRSPTALANYRQSYRYDAGGNLLKLTHVGAQSPGHDLQAARYSNRCLPWRNGVPPDEAQIAAAFDGRGNLLELDQGRLLQWNQRNQLHSVTPVLRDSGLHDREVYLYDGNARRVRKIRTLQTNARAVTTEVRYLPGLQLRSDSASGESLHVISVPGGLNAVRVEHWERPPARRLNDQYRYGFGDHLGSVSLELDAEARIVSREHFYPFGETAWRDEAEVSYKTVRYAGKERDATGLYDFGFRYYAGWLQRWINPDPAGAIDGHNRYRAMRNSPLVYRDDDGRKPGNETEDRTYHQLAERGLVNPFQAAGMQPVRNYFANNLDPRVQAYRNNIPVQLEKLGQISNSPFNTHEAHVRAAAKTGTVSPSGQPLYHSGEAFSAVLNTLVGEKVTSQVMGPLSDAFNSPVADPAVLAGRRDAVANVFTVGGKLLMHTSHPAAQVIGAAGVAMGNMMKASEAQTRFQYQALITPSNVALSTTAQKPAASFQSFDQQFSSRPEPRFADGPMQPATPSELVRQLFVAGFGQSPTMPLAGADDEERLLVRRFSAHG